MSEQWYLHKDGMQQGPFSWETLRQKATSGEIAPMDHVWSEGMGGWTRADEVAGLLYVRPAPLPPPQPAPAPPPPAPAQRAAGAAIDAEWPSPRQAGVYLKASLGRRFLAYLVDGFIASVPGSLIGVVAVIAFAVTADATGDPPALVTILAIGALLVGFGWATLYGLLRDGFGQGQSWGKKALKLMVVRLEDGQPSSKRASAVRNLIGSVLGFIDIIVALVQQKGQRAGDMLTKTQVIDVAAYGRPGY